MIDILRDAVWQDPANVELRMRLVTELMNRSWWQEAMRQCLQVISQDPANVAALNALHTITGVIRAPADQPTPDTERSFDWSAAEADVEGIVEPAYTTEFTAPAARKSVNRNSRNPTTLAQVAGMDEVKRRIESSFLAPIRNPEMARAYGISAEGGILLYGPPGCGKTYIASAIAGEIGANFLALGLDDVLDSYVGGTERNIHDAFVEARQTSPCVIFLDEIDALGQARSRMNAAGAMRSTINQLLIEIESSTGANDGVFVVGATNRPWEVDSALRRPGRFDRTLLVPPPDAEARAAIIRANFDGKPIAGVDLGEFVASTAGFSGADVVHVCREAARRAMDDSVAHGTGQVRYITNDDVRAARSGVTPTVASWFEEARTVVEFANNSGAYDDLAAYMNRSHDHPGRKRRWGRRS